MTIVCIAADLVPDRLGGAEVHAVEVMKRLAKKHTLVVFVGSDTSIKKILPKNVTVLPVSYPRIPNLMGFMYILFGYFQISSQLATRKVQPDIFWAKQSFPQGPVAALLKLRFHNPLYITAQNPMLHFEELVAKGFIRPFQRLFAHAITPFIMFSYRHADVVAAVSRYSEKLAKSMGAKKTTVIPNGVDIEKFILSSSKDNQQPVTRNSLSILTTSSLIPRNGIDTLIKAVALLPKKIQWKLVIAGDGPEKNTLMQLVRAYSNTPLPITFLGRVSNTDIPNLLHKADVFIRPSRKEGFGVSFIEAMAAGVPVIATPVGGIPDFAFHKKTALLVQPDNPKELAKTIETIYNDRTLRKNIITNAKKLVVEKYQWKNIAKQVEQAMQKLNIKK